MKVSIETESILRKWCRTNIPTIQPLDVYLPSWEDFKAQRAAGKVYVFRHGSQNNIFSRRETIWYYRAWHDTIHLNTNNDFSEESEYRVAKNMEIQAVNTMGISQRDARLMRLDIELHIMHYHKWKEHPEYQQNLITDYLILGKKALDKNYGYIL
jgi:hypothetical protein